MEKRKQILMVMPVMKGGGAERVAALLMNEFAACGHTVKFILTSSKEEDVVRIDLKEEIPIILLQDILKKDNLIKKTGWKMIRLISSVLCHFYEKVKIILQKAYDRQTSVTVRHSRLFMSQPMHKASVMG
jgi:hypothetical protein